MRSQRSIAGRSDKVISAHQEIEGEQIKLSTTTIRTAGAGLKYRRPIGHV